jgi:haloalkane dehalogenase
MGLSSRLAPGARPLRLADRVADFGAFMDSLKLSEPVHLVVHDWGGPIALGWAVEAPERVASIAFANTGFRPAPGSRLPASLALFQKSSAGANFLARDLGLFTRGLARVGTLRPLRAAAREGLLAPYAKKAHRASVASFISDIPLGPRHPSFATLEKIRAGFGRLEKKPILLLWGLLDFVFDNLFLEDLYRRFPRAALLTLPRAGHWLFEDEPLKILRGLRRFYASTPTAPL